MIRSEAFPALRCLMQTMNGWYHEMYEPSDLVEKIDEHLNRGHCSDKDKRFLQVLRNSIDEEGNNIMFIGKLLNQE